MRDYLQQFCLPPSFMGKCVYVHVGGGLCVRAFILHLPVAAEMNAAAATAEGAKVSPPKFKQKESRQFKSKAPKAGQKG